MDLALSARTCGRPTRHRAARTLHRLQRAQLDMIRVCAEKGAGIPRSTPAEDITALRTDLVLLSFEEAGGVDRGQGDGGLADHCHRSCAALGLRDQALFIQERETFRALRSGCPGRVAVEG